jgi:hypothetical protein
MVTSWPQEFQGQITVINSRPTSVQRWAAVLTIPSGPRFSDIPGDVLNGQMLTNESYDGTVTAARRRPASPPAPRRAV